MTSRRIAVLVALIAVVSIAPAQKKISQQDGGSWASWRGPLGSGEAAGSPPVTWSEDANVKWKIDLPGEGSSSPIVWGDLIFVTCAAETDKDAPKSEESAADPDRGRGNRGNRGSRGGRRGWMSTRRKATKYWDFSVVAVNRNTGKVAWKKVVANEVPKELGHGTGSLASNSVVTDGKHIFAFFGSRGLHCLTMDGKKVVWSVDLGKMRTRNGFGEGASAAVHGDTIVVVWDHEDDSFIVALNKKTGKEKWRTPRSESTSWVTPLIVEVKGKAQVIVTGTKASYAYNLKTGKVIWTSKGMTVNCIPTPIEQDGVCYLMSGFRGAALQAVDLAKAKGDITDGKAIKWSHGRSTSYVPSALLYQGYLYFVRSNSGVLTCLNAETGEVAYEGERLTGLRTIYASPIGAGGHLYFISRSGNAVVVKAGPEFEVVSNNKLDSTIDASPAVIGDTMYIRGRGELYCIAK